MLNMHTQTVTVKRTDLLSALKNNLEAHREQFAEATADYQALVKQKLSEALARAKAGDFAKVDVNVPKPESYEADFADVIEMMEMSVDETIQLDRDAFKAYFRNEWPWKRQFDSLAQSYKAGGSIGGAAWPQ